MVRNSLRKASSDSCARMPRACSSVARDSLMRDMDALSLVMLKFEVTWLMSVPGSSSRIMIAVGTRGR